MKNLTLLLFVFSTIRCFAFECEIVPQILEYYECKYVFEGKVISKVYSKDISTYQITVEVVKHYKNSDNPKSLSFIMKSEIQFTNYMVSGEIHANVNQYWLVYAIEKNGELLFGDECSRTKRIDKNTVLPYEQKVLDFGNEFEFQDYIFSSSVYFSEPKNITSIEDVLENAPIKEYEKPLCWLHVVVDEKGDLLSVFIADRFRKITDDTFGLTIDIIEINSRPLSTFDRDVIELIKQVKKWEVKKHIKTQIPVTYIKFIEVSYDSKTNKWKYRF